MKILASLSQLTDHQLTAELTRVVSAECSATAVVVATLAEFDARRLYLAHGYTSLFAYCLEELKLSEDATFNRIEAARAARKFPMVLNLLETGELSLTGVRLLAPHLTPANHDEVLQKARHKTKKQIELLLARLRPQPMVPPIIRKLPAARPHNPSRWRIRTSQSSPSTFRLCSRLHRLHPAGPSLRPCRNPTTNFRSRSAPPRVND